MLKAHGSTHPGCQRSRNEDSFLVRPLGGQSMLLAVADGLGGEPAGDLASALVVRALEEQSFAGTDPIEGLGQAVEKACRLMAREVERHPDLEGMGSTVTAAHVSGRLVHWIHVGDSRLYLFSQGRLSQVTRDQNFLQDLVEEGRVSPEEAGRHPLRRLLEQCVGAGGCEPSLGSLELSAGDLLLLATDGLGNALAPGEIAATLAAQAGERAAVEGLIQAALGRQADDNLAVVAALMP